MLPIGSKVRHRKWVKLLGTVESELFSMSENTYLINWGSTKSTEKETDLLRVSV
jgi:hypothetical protein